MKKKRVLALTALLLVCVFGISACKKNVGTPEDNPERQLYHGKSYTRK